MIDQRAAQRKLAGRAGGRQPGGEWRPAPVLAPAASSPLPAIQRQAATPATATPVGHTFGELALFPPVQAFGTADAATAAVQPLGAAGPSERAPEPLAARVAPGPVGAAGRLALQRVFLRDGVKVSTEDPFEHALPGVAPAVKVVCYRTRHTIRGLVKEGTMKETNTVLVTPVEMTRVAAAAYAVAWNAEAGRLNVPDGTTFVSEGVTWGLNARRTDNSIHIWPESGAATANVTRGEYAPLGAYLKQRAMGKGHDEAKAFALNIVKRISGNEQTFTRCADALEAMQETEG